MGLVVNCKTVQQPTILVTFFQITESIVRTRHRGRGIEIVKVFIIATSIVFIILVINCQLAFKFDNQVL